MFEYASDRALLVGDGQTNFVQCLDVRRSLLQGTSYLVSTWNPNLDYNGSNTLDPSTFPIGFGRDENGSPSTVSAIFTDKDLKVYSRVTTPLLSSVTTVTSVPTSMYISSTRTYYTTGNTIYNNTNSVSSTIQRKNQNGDWTNYDNYNPTGIVKDKRDIYWLCSKDLGRISRLANNIDGLSAANFGQAGRIDYEEEIKDNGTLLKPTGLAVLPEKSAMFDTDLDESGRFWICCDNGYIYEIKVTLNSGGIEMLESMSGVGTNHFITCYVVEDI